MSDMDRAVVKEMLRRSEAYTDLLTSLIELYVRCENKSAYPEIRELLEREKRMTIDEITNEYEEYNGK
jgi:DNA-binding transcriptional regulator YbjK